MYTMWDENLRHSFLVSISQYVYNKIGSLSNYDDDGDEKTIDLMIKTTALHVHHGF